MRKLFGEKGIALFMALGLLMIVVVFANIVLTLMLSQSRVTGHQVGRIQAYYAGTAGMNLALDNLRSGIWGFDAACAASATCVQCTEAAPCGVVDAAMIDPTGVDTAVTAVNIVFCPRGDNCSVVADVCTPPSGDLDFCIDTNVTYLLHPPVI